MDGPSAIVVVVLVLLVLVAVVVDYRQELIACGAAEKRLRDDLTAAVLLMPNLLDASDQQAVELARRWLKVMRGREELAAREQLFRGRRP